MTSSVSLPLWIFLILLLSAAVLFVQYVVYPMVAAYINARALTVTEELNPRLQLRLSPFTLTRRHVLADRLASDPVVEAALDDMARRKGLSKEEIRRETWRMAWDIVPAFNPYFYFRVGYRLARAGLRSLYHITVAFEDEASMEDVSSDDAVLFIINHRSNIDYAVVNYLTSQRTMLSFGVGEWSRIWPIQPFFRMAGGYFVRRGSNDPHYRLLLKRYVQMATEARVPHAIFIEGMLTKDGGVNPPRTGLLSYVSENFDPETSADLVFIPIALNYDRVIEDVNVVRYSTSEFQSMGTLYVVRQGVMFMFRVLVELIRRQRRMGMHCSVFGVPISFKSWLRERGVDWSSLDRAGRHEQITALGQRLYGDIKRLVPATPMSILCEIWYESPEARLDVDEARDRFNKNVERLNAGGCHVALLRRDLGKSFDHALSMAGKRKMIVMETSGQLVMSPKQKAIVLYYGKSVSQFLEI